MEYFYCQPGNIGKDLIIIDGDEFSHLTHVMRRKEGDEIRVVDGLGNAFDVRLTQIKKRTAEGTIFNRYKNHNEPVTDLTLAVGILKNPSKFDFLVEKSAEIGAKKIIPLLTERTIPRHARIDRWQKLALAAMKQSGRSFLPVITGLISLDEAISEINRYDLCAVAHEKSEILNPFHRAKTEPRSVIVLIGPEGGFSDAEIEKCLSAGATSFAICERRLRTETAAVISAALALYLSPPKPAFS